MGVPSTFQAYQYESYGPAEQQLRLRSGVQQRSLQPHELRVKVRSAALNPADQKVMEEFGLAILGGAKPSKDQPFGMGFDFSGTVVEAGANATSFQVGDDVFAMTPFDQFGAFAEYIVIDEQFVARKPENVTFEQAASVPYAALTSYQALLEHAKVARGDRVLILGGTTSTGIFAVEIAHAIGAHVTATARKCDDVLFLKSLGAERVLQNPKKWVDAVEEHSIDVVYDCGVDHRAWNRDAQRVLKRDTGRFVTLNPMQNPKSQSKQGPKCLGEIRVRPSAAQIQELSRLLERGALTAPIDSVFAFEQLPEALQKLKSKKVRGKIVLQVASA